MATQSNLADDAALFAYLTAPPQIDMSRNVQAALAAGRNMTSILTDVVSLRRGVGRLTPAEYFYYRLWNRELPQEEKRRFVGKQAQHAMHMACNHTGWYATAADKLLFHTLMTGAQLPVPPLLAVAHPSRRSPTSRVLPDKQAVAAFLREPSNYPLFAKPIDGKYSISVLSAEHYDVAHDVVALQEGERVRPETLADTLASRPDGYLFQRRLNPPRTLADAFGPRLWSVRMLVLLMQSGPVIHRALAKIATGNNPADNFWRTGNMLGAIDVPSGTIKRVIRGTGVETVLNPKHPDTGHTVVETVIPHWDGLKALVTEASTLLPAIRTQSWDVALSESGPVLLEVNFGGDLNLSQLASGVGVLDEVYATHLAACGYKGLPRRL